MITLVIPQKIEKELKDIFCNLSFSNRNSRFIVIINYEKNIRKKRFFETS